MQALLIIDLQNDFMPGGALPVPKGDEVIPLIDRLIPHFSLVFATQDWHPKNHASFGPHLWPVHCVQGTKGAELVPLKNRKKIEKIIFKGTDPKIDSYSAFFDNEHVKSTGLIDELEARGVDEIYVVGVATDYCVLYSVLDALELGLKVNVIVDGCRGIQGESQALQKMGERGARLLTSKDFLASLAR